MRMLCGFNSVFITLKLPISHEKEPLQLYEIISLPVPVNESSTHATQLLNLPNYLAITSHQQFYLTLDKVDIATCHKHHLYLCNFNKAFKPVTEKSCVISLFANDKDNINTICDFRFLTDHLSPTAMEVSDETALIYNSKMSLSLVCPNNKTIIQGCNFCLIQLPCRCSITSKYWLLSPKTYKLPNDEENRNFSSHKLGSLATIFQQF